jgi:hypothetical protein
VLARQEQEIYDLEDAVTQGAHGAEGRLRKMELAKAQTQEKRDRRLGETRRGRTVRRGPVRVLATCLVLPHVADGAEAPPEEQHGLSNDEVEQIAVAVSMRYEREHGADHLKSVEADNVGFDLLSVRGIERRCIEVKGRAGVGGVELTWSEFAKAIELGDDYWLYVVLDCASDEPRLYRVQNPAKNLSEAFKPHLDVRYGVAPQPVIEASEA